MIRRAVPLVLLAACGGGNSGPDAMPPDATIGQVVVSGTVRYEDRAQLTTGMLATTVSPLPARHVSVGLIAQDGTSLGETVTADDGSYSITANNIRYGDILHVLAATVSTDTVRPVEVDRTDRHIHGFGGPTFEALDLVTANLLVSETSSEAEAFNVYDQLINAVDRITALGLTPAHITAVWQTGATDGTYYSSLDNTMHLLGASDDDDGYDDSVVLHESGHYVEDTQGRSDNPGGFHDGSPADPRLGWSEGFSTYWSMVVTARPIYIDSNAAGGWAYNGEATITHASQPAGPLTQLVSEDMVTEILWDLGDPANETADTFEGTHDAVITVEPAYLKTATLRGVGVVGVDLVDFLDGFFMADGVTRCAAVTGIVTTTHQFPYDYPDCP